MALLAPVALSPPLYPLYSPSKPIVITFYLKGLSPWLLRPPQVVCRRGRRLSEHITGIGGALWDRSGLPSVLEPIALAQWFHLSVLSGKRRMAGSASSLDLPSLPPSILSDRGHHL